MGKVVIVTTAAEIGEETGKKIAVERSGKTGAGVEVMHTSTGPIGAVTAEDLVSGHRTTT